MYGVSHKMAPSEQDSLKALGRIRRRPFLRYLERRKTDTIVDEDSGKGDVNVNTLVRRSQSDKTEYSARLKGKLAPHDLPSPLLEPEEIRHRKMVKRSKVIEELRVMKYPLLLAELHQATPIDHPDNQPLQEALTTVKIINLNINEFKRRKDIVMKYKRTDDEGTLKGKLNKLNIHSIRKKSDRITGYIKILTGVEPQDMITVAVQDVEDLEAIMKNPDKIDTNGFQQQRNGHDPYKHLVESLDRLVLSPLSSLQSMFTAPQKLIQKRYDKLLDSCSSGSEEQLQAQLDYQALNAQLTVDLQRFNHATQTILTNCLVTIIKLLQDLTEGARPLIHQLPAPLSNISEVQNSIMDEISNLMFFRENSQRLMERKVSFEKRDRRNMRDVHNERTDDFDNLSLFVSGSRRGSHSSYSPSTPSSQQEETPSPEDEEQHELSLQEYQHVRILQFSDQGGNKDWWLAESKGQKGYVPANYLGKMSYA
ncbi:Rho guanine nucleotide exchange factor 38 [Bagarius yarrelli]|uniref:Rho guanine nucleotide exchange factor 38 n=1 Tax=Bagarius yarrelli TaxID=175774 RepID=A0A556VV10_BAGYA|nr:Rho guanine nucleotide exchange factor 38 [Bagarius yarrelli]